jgi:dolichol-phosphate mannosyltransferase
VACWRLGKTVRNEFFQNDIRTAIDQGPIELAIIIPTFNESTNIIKMVESLSLVLADIHWEAIFVDDNSPDGTADLVRQIARENSNIRIVHRIGRRGLSTAVIEGMLASAAPVLAVIDGDMQHDEAILPQLYAAVASGRADIAVGTRYGEGGSVGSWDESRVRGSRIATKIGQWVLKSPLSDPMSGFFIISRETLMQAIPRISGVGFKILLDIILSLRQRPRMIEIPYTFRSRERGESKASALVAAEYLSLLADKTIGRFVPLRLLSFLAVGGLGVAVHLGILGMLLAIGIAFVASQIIAVMSAMTFNFFLNNIFTYHDRRLRGWRILTGLISFYMVCSLGAVANIGIGSWMNAQHNQWWVAGLAGVLIGAVWNFAAASFVTWRK